MANIKINEMEWYGGVVRIGVALPERESTTVALISTTPRSFPPITDT
jgi:hypothetical protein